MNIAADEAHHLTKTLVDATATGKKTLKIDRNGRRINTDQLLASQRLLTTLQRNRRTLNETETTLTGIIVFCAHLV